MPIVDCFVNLLGFYSYNMEFNAEVNEQTIMDYENLVFSFFDENDNFIGNKELFLKLFEFHDTHFSVDETAAYAELENDLQNFRKVILDLL